MVDFPFAEAQIVSLFVQSVIYGIHATIFAIYMWTWIRRSKGSRKSINWPMLSVAIVLFVIGTTDLVFNLYHNIVAFIYYTGPGGATGEFEHISNWANVIRTLVQSVWTFVQTLIADGALIYRCLVIYTRRRWVVVAPIIIWFADAACAVAELYYTATLEQNTNLANARTVQPFVDGFVTLALANNIMTTGKSCSLNIICLIVYRIHRIHKQSAQAFSSGMRVTTGSRIKLSEVNRILIESALLYTATAAIALIVNLARSNAVYVTSGIVTEMAGIQFDLIMIRVNRGIAAEQVQAATETIQFELRETASNYRRGVITTQSAVDSASADWEGKDVPIISSLIRNEDQSG
ncbi:uncharacterized protein LAESUDRAFT_655190 [Laetiporus sulphureus 93-53]|uniref:Uncharacterized protein n=1 Tax=Laetiporus sulphureus 93-53 TaxID=1314785 RepID=A0A165DWL9_9APHY|nr:uncharacterized protein LAESUDRAFT_655190 [Laetiporus sulphureus 93-53]KZT05780.1 hypothetical protein LAESUDRAFT_655190 [Laetiporus sulphureus 93-53]